MNNPTITIAIAGNPNCGKSLVFNLLTGSRQKVGNWSGVTVDKKAGQFQHQQVNCIVIDLPGIYSLNATSSESALDEKIACRYILSGEADVIVNVLDGSNLERNLYLTSQLLEMKMPIILAVNMMDTAAKRGLTLDLNQLSKHLGCPVVAMTASKGIGIKALKDTIIHTANQKTQNLQLMSLPLSLASSAELLQHAIQQQLPQYQHQSLWLARSLLEGNSFAHELVGDDINQLTKQQCDIIACEAGDDVDILLADARFSWVNDQIANIVKHKKTSRHTLTQILDKLVLNRILGIPIFFFVMYCMFLFAINIGSAFQDFFDIGSTTIFVDGLSYLLTRWHVPIWLTALLANGVGKGINTTITFIPVIGGMFLFLSFLEDSGYMARAAFVMDRLMRAIGLPGKAFVPMIVGFGCNVPTVMASRTLANRRDRILTVMMAPFMSCGARLAVYALFTSAFFPQGGHNVIFCLYLLGIIAAVLTGLLLRRTVLPGDNTPIILELPTYHAPKLTALWRHTWHRLKAFIFRAGRYIIPVCVLIGTLNSISIDGKLINGDANEHSLLSNVGKLVTPVFKPMGITENNWPATVGLVSGLLAKEVVVGTLNTLYSQVGHLTPVATDEFNLRAGLYNALTSVPKNLAAIPDALSNPIAASGKSGEVTQGVYGVMYQYFDGHAGAFAYLLFVLLYFPCISTMAAMRREIGHGWAYFSMLWTTGLAYGMAVLFYQIATFMQHPIYSISWIAGILLCFAMVIYAMRYYARTDKKYISSTSKILKVKIVTE